jgi:hypothetical protein
LAFHAGQTFLYPIEENETAHLWVIATEPNIEGLFAIASLTSLKGAKDQNVILRANEHPFLKWDTCVMYALAEITSEDKVQEYLNTGSDKMQADLSTQVLGLVLDGSTASDRTKNRVRQFINEYRGLKGR